MSRSISAAMPFVIPACPVKVRLELSRRRANWCDDHQRNCRRLLVQPTQLPQSERLRIREIHFDDIPYIGMNVADSKDVVICDNVFENFRYDLLKAANSTYVIGINIGAKDAVISNNRFMAGPNAVPPETLRSKPSSCYSAAGSDEELHRDQERHVGQRDLAAELRRVAGDERTGDDR